jgi:ADP-ribosylglycohydrolase
VTLDRALGALWGLALGDALGMPTQSLPRSGVVARFGPLLAGLEPGPPDQPLAPGLPAGSVTDDSEQALLLGELLVEGAGRVDPLRLAERLLAWEDDMRRRGRLDLLGPSTRRALDRLAHGVDPAEAGRDSTTNGAAMRVTPVGVAWLLDPLDALVDAVVAASALTHGTSVALAGAAAVAAAVSAGIGGATVVEAIDAATVAAERAGSRGRPSGGPLAPRIRRAVVLGRGRTAEEVLEVLPAAVGTSLAVEESVPAAFGVLAAVPDDPWLACRVAASLGGDTDTIAAMVGAVAGAAHGVAALPGDARETVAAVNGLDLGPLAEGLLALRARG